MISTIIGETEMQYRHFDSPARAQVPSVEFRRELMPDANGARAPYEVDKGFWPSLSPASPGWIGSNNQAEFARQMEGARCRLAAFGRGEWFYVGVLACAIVHVPVGGNSFAVYTLQSPGIWGIESDADEEYLNEIYADECAALRDAMKHFGDLAEA